MLNQMYYELKAVKTMLEIPRFRASLPQYDFKGMNYNKFVDTFGQIYYDIADKFQKNSKHTEQVLGKHLGPLEPVMESDSMPNIIVAEPTNSNPSQVALLLSNTKKMT